MPHPAAFPVAPHTPHLNLIERLWRAVHRSVTHNRFYPDFCQFREVITDFFDKTLSRKREGTAETVTDNLRVITSDEYALLDGFGVQKYRLPE